MLLFNHFSNEALGLMQYVPKSRAGTIMFSCHELFFKCTGAFISIQFQNKINISELITRAIVIHSHNFNKPARAIIELNYSIYYASKLHKHPVLPDSDLSK